MVWDDVVQPGIIRKLFFLAIKKDCYHACFYNGLLDIYVFLLCLTEIDLFFRVRLHLDLSAFSLHESENLFKFIKCYFTNDTKRKMLQQLQLVTTNFNSFQRT